jgi:hydroxyacylglutathione hydrolase
MLFSMDRYTDLPPNTLVYCGHEYTESNLRFALAVEPENKDIELRIKEVGELRNSNQPSLPSNIETELKINPFLRCREANVINAAQNYSSKQLNEASDVLGEIRNWKDNF